MKFAQPVRYGKRTCYFRNRYKIALVLCAKHFACRKYVVFQKTDFKTNRLDLSISSEDIT